MSTIYDIEDYYPADDNPLADDDRDDGSDLQLLPGEGGDNLLEYTVVRTLQLVLQTLSGTGLVANLVVLSIAVVATLSKRSRGGAAAVATMGSAFFVHHCILDAIKSALCLAFSGVMVPLPGGQSATVVVAHDTAHNDTSGGSNSGVGSNHECTTVGTVYIVLVTTSVFNMLAITVNQNYHFTSQLVEGGQDLNDPFCIAFGVGITWFASIIINIGIAFLPSQPGLLITTGQSAANVTGTQHPSSCPYVYGMTGSYVLNLLWIALITLTLALNAFYLRRLRADITDRYCSRLAFDGVSSTAAVLFN